MTIPAGYKSLLTLRETEHAIKQLKDHFETELSRNVGLQRVTAPLFVRSNTGLNDDLNGVEKPVSFHVKQADSDAEMVQSLAKWKRFALMRYGFEPGEGLYTNMNAIRRDEELDNLHSSYVDQWDWEMVVRREDRTPMVLHEVVRKIFKIIKHMEHEVWYKYPDAFYHLPDTITFITSEELEARWPDKTRHERENLIAKECGAVFIMRIGWPLADGKPHDGRAPDYDDWNLNGDIMFWFEPLSCALEISSMGIRVDEVSMREQLAAAGCLDRMKLPYHKMLLRGVLPYTIGGGIGQSRLCMLLLGRAHVGEVQASVWPEEMRAACEDHNIMLL